MSVVALTRGSPVTTNGVNYPLNKCTDIDDITVTQHPQHLNDRPTLQDTNKTSAELNILGHKIIIPDNANPDFRLNPSSGTTLDKPPHGNSGSGALANSTAPLLRVIGQDGDDVQREDREILDLTGQANNIRTSVDDPVLLDTSSPKTSLKRMQMSFPTGQLNTGLDIPRIPDHGVRYFANESAGDLVKDDQSRMETTVVTTSNIENIEPSNRSTFPTESQTPSQRVRSLYDLRTAYRAAEPMRPASATTGQQKENLQEDTARELHSQGLSPGLSSTGGGAARGGRSVSAMSSRSSMLREPGEIAGGIEDWTDINAKDVDRYGFISRPRTSSFKNSSSIRNPNSANPDSSRGQPPVTSLHVIDEIGSTVPPASLTSNVDQFNDNIVSQPPSATFSNRKTPRVSRFNTIRSSRSRQRRLLASADSMLDLSFEQVRRAEPSRTTVSDPARMNLELKRSAKWLKMATPVSPAVNMTGVGAGSNFTFDTTDSKVVSRTWKGIPDRWRATAWHSFLTSAAIRRSSTGLPEPSDSTLIARFHDLQDMDCADDMQIDLDVPRTVGQHIMFRRRYRGGQRLLFRVLRALSLHFPDIGYVQGMAAVVSTLLCYFDEELAFVVAFRMWTLRGVAWLYTGGFDGLMEALEDFERDWIDIGDKQQALKNKLQNLGVGATVWGAKWYLTLFNYSLPFQAQLRVWDVFLLLGDSSPLMKLASPKADKIPSSLYPKPNLDVMHAVAAALLLGLKKQLLNADFEGAMEQLTGTIIIAEGRGEDVLMDVAKALTNQKVR